MANDAKQFVMLAVSTTEEGGATHAWGNLGVGSEGWVRINCGQFRSLEKMSEEGYQSIRLMSSDEACRKRDCALKFDLSEHAVILVEVA